MKSSLNQLLVDCTDTGSAPESVPLPSPWRTATYFTSHQSKCFSFFSCSLSFFLSCLFFLFFIKIYALSHKYLCICAVVVPLSPPPRLLCSLANFCQLTEAQSHVHRPCVCRHFLTRVARVSISRCFLWLYGQPWWEKSVAGEGVKTGGVSVAVVKMLVIIPLICL